MALGSGVDGRGGLIHLLSAEFGLAEILLSLLGTYQLMALGNGDEGRGLISWKGLGNDIEGAWLKHWAWKIAFYEDYFDC